MPVHSLFLPLLVLLTAPLSFLVIGRIVFGANPSARRLGVWTGMLLMLLLAFFVILRWTNPAASENADSSGNIQVDETKILPGLFAIDLSDRDLLRWDGSTSLRPLADLIVSRLTGISGDEMAVSEVEFWPRHPFSKTHDAIVNLIEGRRDLVFSARKPSEDEWELARELGVKLVYTPFARDAFVFLVHQNNPVHDLGRDQVRAVYEGRLTSWSEAIGRTVRIDPPPSVGYKDWPGNYSPQEIVTDEILPLVRNRNSGSEELMRELVMGDSLVRAKSAQVVELMSEIFNVLEGSANAIGYSLLYFEKYLAPKTYVRHLSIDGIAPSRETVSSGAYPYVYDCYLIHRESPGEKTEHFIRWLLGPEGRETVSDCGYVPGPGITNGALHQAFFQHEQARTSKL